MQHFIVLNLGIKINFLFIYNTLKVHLLHQKIKKLKILSFFQQT